MRTFIAALGVAFTLSIVSPAFAADYTVESYASCSQAPANAWAQCVLDSAADASDSE